MAETITITCDRCKRRLGTPKITRNRIRFSRVSGRKPMDLCEDCGVDLRIWLKVQLDDEPKPDAAKPPARRPPAKAKVLPLPGGPAA